jgi:hypothetical protein
MADSYTTLARLKANANIGGTADDTRLTSAVAAANAYVESYIGAAITQSGGTVNTARTFDVDGATKSIHIPYGIQDVATLEYAEDTEAAQAGTYGTVATDQYILRGTDGQPTHMQPAGWPGFWVILIDGSTPGFFRAGYDTVRLTPTTGWGWSAIPEDLARVADILALRLFQSSQSGESLAIGSTDFGAAIIRFLPEPEHVWTMDRYRTVIAPSWSA